MPNTRAALLAAVAADPDDDAPRLIYADWLDEQGESSRAEFIRLQCRAARLPRQDDGRFTLERRADELLLEHERAWLGDWHERLVRWEFRRGFVHAATVTADVFRRDGAALFAAEPVERLGFVDDNGDPLSEEGVPDVVSRPAFGHIRSLDILGATPARHPFRHWHTYWRGPHVRVGAWLKALADAEYVVRLRAFLPGGDLGLGFGVRQDDRIEADREALEAFCRADHLRTLTLLDLRGLLLNGRASEAAFRALTAAAFAPRVRRLDFSGWRLNDAAVAHLAATCSLPELRFLNLSHNGVTTAGAAALFAADGLKHLDNVLLDDRHLPTLAASPIAGRLRGLNVNLTERQPDRHLLDDTWRRLVATGRPPRFLALGCHDPGAAAFLAMRQNRWLRRVRTLQIQNDSQSDGCFRLREVWDLLRSGGLPRLTRLRTHEYATDRFCEALGRWPGLARLETLTLTDDYYGRLAPVLFDWPHGNGRLRHLHGLRLASDVDVDRLATCGNLGGVRQVSLAFVGPVSAEALGRLFRGPTLENIEALWVHFEEHRNVGGGTTAGETYRLLADPTTLPRLRALVTWTSVAERALEAVRRRLGPRLKT